MNVIVNPRTQVNIHTNPDIIEGYIIIETEPGFHYINDKQVFFIPREEAERIVKMETVRNIFGTEE